jgi:hypothetical protein
LNCCCGKWGQQQPQALHPFFRTGFVRSITTPVAQVVPLLLADPSARFMIACSAATMQKLETE